MDMSNQLYTLAALLPGKSPQQPEWVPNQTRMGEKRNDILPLMEIEPSFLSKPGMTVFF
jgi:hypothetical protein